MGHEEKSLPDVRGAEARSAEIKRREGVALVLHVRLNKVEPSESVFARNLLSKDHARAALADEREPCRPEVTFILKACSDAGRAERLAGAGAGPDFVIIGPAGKPEGVAPDPDSGEEMALPVSSQVVRSNIDN